ncbi:MAG: aminotransferase class I/II-fold pyridoxal phosphate-dependent enzyme [Bacteroidota bacterium]
MENNRRNFLKKCSLSTIPFLLPATSLNAFSSSKEKANQQTSVNFFFDGLALSPSQYLEKLQQINQTTTIEPDFYGNGGATKLLEDKFVELTGKEKAIYLPTGTMANQLAIKLLNGNNTKVIVPENSHIFRDEADAAQSVHNKRLIPVGKGKPYYSLTDLKDIITYTDQNEVFKSGLGTIVIENPIRRADGTCVPIETIREISEYCKAHNYNLHLDGARIHIACAYSNISLLDYAAYFDTIYISLYKYLNASGGAILCGDAKIIDQISHQIKILGGTVFQTWNNTAMALHYLEGINEKWNEVVSTATQLFSDLNQLKGVSIKHLKNGTNIYDLKLSKEINLKKLANYLNEEHNILLGRANKNGVVKLTVNASILTREREEMVNAWRLGIKKAIE